MLEKEELKKWRKISRERFKIDGYKCMRCKTHHNWGRGLTAHHILARRDGGKDFIDNLISLCNKCHDEVEGLRLNAWEITNMSPPPDGRKISRPTSTRMTTFSGAFADTNFLEFDLDMGPIDLLDIELIRIEKAEKVRIEKELADSRDPNVYKILQPLSSICARDEDGSKSSYRKTCFLSYKE